MKIRSVAIFEDELKELLSNPHTSSNMRNAVSLAEQILELKKNSYRFIDCQVPSEHLKSMGAEEISREEFLKILIK